MQDSRILSTLQDVPPSLGNRPLPKTPEAGRAGARVFDTCQVGVVLRAVLFVQAVVCVMALYGAHSVWDWVMQVALFTAATLPSALIWLLALCALQRPLARLPLAAQGALGIALGALAALYGCGLLSWTGLVSPAPWLASAACKRASAPTFCSTHSTAPSRSCAPSRPRPRRCSKT
jgi:two-component system, LytTR family, sensor histidine kinase AlgZ